MLANFFNKAKPANYVLITLLFVVLYILAFFNSDITTYTFKIIMLKLIDIFLLLFMMFLYNFIIFKNKLTANNHFGILFISLLFGALYPILIHTKILLAAVLLGLAFRRIYSLNIHNNLKNKLFDSGFLIALSSFFFQENTVFIVLVYFAILAFRHFKWNFIFIPIVGFATPYFLSYIYSLGSNNWYFFNKIFKLNIAFSLDILNNKLFLFYTVIIVLLSSFSYILFTIKSKVFSNKFKALWILVLEHFILSLLLLFLGNKSNFYNSTLLIFPSGVILANYAGMISKKWVKEIFIILLVTLSLSSIIYSFVP